MVSAITARPWLSKVPESPNILKSLSYIYLSGFLLHTLVVTAVPAHANYFVSKQDDYLHLFCSERPG